MTELINIFLNACLICVMINLCIKTRNNIKNAAFVILAALIICVMTKWLGVNVIYIALVNIALAVLIVFFFKKEVLSALIGFALSWFVSCFFKSLFFIIALFVYLNTYGVSPEFIENIYRILESVYIGIVIFLIIYNLKRSEKSNDKEKITRILKVKDSSMTSDIIFFAAVIQLITAKTIQGKYPFEDPVVALTGFVLFFIIFEIFKMTGEALYENRIIKTYNEKIKQENDKLRKIKHDYGAQISYLHGMCLLNRKKELGEAIDRIIFNSEAVGKKEFKKDGVNETVYKAILKNKKAGMEILYEEEENEAAERITEDKNLIYKKIDKIIGFLSASEREEIIAVHSEFDEDEAKISIEMIPLDKSRRKIKMSEFWKLKKKIQMFKKIKDNSSRNFSIKNGYGMIKVMLYFPAE